MKRVISLTGIPAVIGILGCIIVLNLAACKSGSKAAASSDLIGKLVISELCNHFVVSIESGDVDPSLITDSFRDEKRATTYSRVFTVGNSCQFQEAGLKEGDRFSFSISPKPIEDTCMVCMAYYPTPETRLSVTNIRKLD
ncbi:MAG TPA: hypothetical protein VIK80_01000 [Flavihumibacter sp.]|jgi:hypothetical protein